ncbi:hypothetical protein ACFLYJ_01420 [Candidatus Cloacimonadota bacterium]
MTYKIVSVIRPEVFKIENCEDKSVNLLIDRRMADNRKDKDSTKLKTKLIDNILNQIVSIEQIKYLAVGLLAGSIYLKGKHLSFFYGSKKDVTAGES